MISNRMETVSWKQLIDMTAMQTPLTFEADGSLSTADFAAFNRIMNRAIRRGWEWYWWPTLMLHEERHYRDAWLAEAYEEDDEVWHEDTGAYYRAGTATLTSDVPGTTGPWVEITDFVYYIAYAQRCEQAFSHAYEVWTDNPRLTPTARRIEWEYDEYGVRLKALTAPVSAWLHFRQRCPTYRGPDFDDAATYDQGDVVYFADDTDTDYEGDYWECCSDTTAGQTPITHPDNWSRLPVPSFLADFAAGMAAVYFTKGETALSNELEREKGSLWDLLIDEKSKLCRGQLNRVRVANI